MFSFLLRRFLQSLLSLALVTILVFSVMFAAGDPATILLPQTATDRDRQVLREKYGLDKPLHVQFGRFVSRAARGDFGDSYYQGRPVLTLLAERAPATIELACVSMLMALAIGVPLGVLAAVRPKSLAARASMWASMIGISLPTFWLGLLLMMYFGVKLQWLPSMGRGSTRGALGADWSVLTLNGWSHILLPAFTLALHHVAMLLRLVRSELGETLRAPFIRVCRARGLSPASVVGKHAMRNTLIPIVTVAGVEFGQLLAFSVVTETIFQWPGLGKLLIESIFVDRPLVVAYLMLTCAAFLAINFAVDVVYAFIDPRIRLSARGEAA